MENFIITISYLVIGMVLRRLPQFHEETGNVLNLFVIYVALPALVLLKIPELAWSRELLIPAIMPWGMLMVSAIMVLALSTLLHWTRPVTGCLLLLVPMGNTSFLGIPMVRAFLGESGIPYAVIYDQLGSFLALATYGSVILAIYGVSGAAPSFSAVLKKIITFPPFIALLLAFMLKPFPYPMVAQTLLKTLGGTLVPVVMIAVGFQLKIRLSPAYLTPLCLGLIIKLIIAPLIALLSCRALGLQGTAVDVSIFEAGMPPMVSAGALALLAQMAPPLTAALVGLGIIFSFATLPVLFQFL